LRYWLHRFLRLRRKTPLPRQNSVAPSSGMRAEFLADLQTQEQKFVSLAQAIPADKYTWRPAEGVRSVSEVFLHVGQRISTFRG